MFAPSCGTKKVLSQNDLKNQKRQHLFCAESIDNTEVKKQKIAHLLREASFATLNARYFLFFMYYAVSGTTRCEPKRPVWILWCSFRMLYAMLTRCHSTVTFPVPRVRKRRKFIASFTIEKTPSA